MNSERSHLLELSVARKNDFHLFFKLKRFIFFLLLKLKNAQSNLAQTDQTEKARLKAEIRPGMSESARRIIWNFLLEVCCQKMEFVSKPELCFLLQFVKQGNLVQQGQNSLRVDN
jgi:hypothetical protein